MSRLIENYNIVNCYVDTTFVNVGTGAIMVSSFSSDDDNIQEKFLENSMRVTVNDGYKFDVNSLEEYYFDMQFQPLDNNLRQFQLNNTLPFTRVTLADFEPVTDISTYEWIKDYVNYQLYVSVEPENSMFYTFTVGNTTHLILLYGGIRDNDLLFFTFAKKQSSNNTVSFSMNGEEWVSVSTFSTEMLDMETWENLELSFLNNLNFVAIESSNEPIEDVSKYLFDSYYIENADLSRLKNTSALTSELLINTYSYPLNFSGDTLIDVTFTVAGITQNIPAKKFLKNINDIEIFKFQVPDVPDVREVKLRIPFNNDVTISYEDVRGKTITGRFSYEVLTNTTTLIINDGTTDIYNTMVVVGVTVPYRPTGEYKGGSDPTTRLAKTDPKLFIKGVGKTISGNFIQGFIRSPISNILSSERDTLNTLLKEGVYFND